MNGAHPFVHAKPVLVLGLGESGLSMVRWLTRHGARVRVADTRVQPPGLAQVQEVMPQAELRLGAFDEALLEDMSIVALSPGISPQEPLVQAAMERGLPIVGDVELFARALPQERRSKIIAITGTNGKTTVTALTGAMCRAAGLDTEVAGNIGPAVLDALMTREDSGRQPDVWVLELSSFQLEITESLRPDVATVLNVSEDHLDRHVDLADYAEIKSHIYYGGGAQVVNREDRYSASMAIPGRRCLSFGLDAAPDSDDFGLLNLSGEWWLAQGVTPLLAVRDMPLQGLHNAANALAALALARSIGLPLKPSIEALRQFRALPHRVEPVAEIDGIRFYNDSKGTNVGATVAALQGFERQLQTRDGKVVLIAGGVGKGQDFTPLNRAVSEAARAVVLIGRDAPLLRAALCDSDVPLYEARDMSEAVSRARSLARPGDVVLLSPACASLDMYKDYRHRGDVFREAVEGLDRS